MNEPLIMEAANLYCGSDPTASNHLILTELRLPAFERNYQDHAAGGAPIAIEIDTHTLRLEATFSLSGWQPQVLGLLGAGDQTFTIYGLIRNRRTGWAGQAEAIIQGRLGRVTPTPFARGTVQAHEYAIRSIMHYALSLDGEQLFYWDFLEAATSTIQPEDPAARLRRTYPDALQ